MKGRRAHVRALGESIHAHRFIDAFAHPPDDVPHAHEPTVGEPELANRGPLIAGHDEPQQLALDQGRENRNVSGVVEEAQHPNGGVEEARGSAPHGDGRRGGSSACRPCKGGGRRTEHELGDHFGAQLEAEPQSGMLGGCVHELPGDREVDRRNEVLARPVVVDRGADGEPLGSLRDHRENRAGVRLLLVRCPDNARHEDAGNRSRRDPRKRARVADEQGLQLREGHASIRARGNARINLIVLNQAGLGKH